jgi:catechol 2,3-dioxygenase-like lactoylglutathione lyase family enzyme
VVDGPRSSGLNVGMHDDARPGWRSVVLDTTDARALAEFYRQLLGYEYQAGDELPPAGQDDPNGRDWLMLQQGAGGPMLAFQQVEELPASTWPGTDVPQQLHLDLTVHTTDALAAQHARALDLGARLLLDRSDDPEEPIYVYADPDGHPFCIFVAPT